MAKSARHMAADAAAHQNGPEQRHGPCGTEVNQQAQNDVEQAQQPFALEGPMGIMPQLQDQKPDAAGDGEVMPGDQLGKRDAEKAAAEKQGGNPDVAGAYQDAEPPYGTGWSGDSAVGGAAFWLPLRFRHTRNIPVSSAHRLFQRAGLVFGISRQPSPTVACSLDRVLLTAPFDTGTLQETADNLSLGSFGDTL